MSSQFAMANTVARAQQSLGSSDRAIYQMVARVWERFGSGMSSVLDVGCGTGRLRAFLPESVTRYAGVDLLRYDGYPAEAEFHQADLDACQIDIPDGAVDAAISVETIEHLENPRAFVRELTRVVRLGGWVVITTPNQLSWLSKASLLLKGRFAAFGPRDYPAHITALLELDLRRIASECGLNEVLVAYSLHGRIPLTPWPYPRALARIFPRGLSDNLLLAGRKPL